MPGEITELLVKLHEGDTSAESELAPLVYAELHRIAACCMKFERNGHSLQPTMLVHDAYLKLVDHTHQTWQNRSHFFAVAASLMRRILVDYARRRNAVKRGRRRPNVDLDKVLLISDVRIHEIVVVDEALTRLTERDPHLGRIVELKFFAGLTDEEIAGVLSISERTVVRQWRLAKAWLQAELADSNGKSEDVPV